LNVGYPGGKTRQVSLRPDQVAQVREALENYRTFIRNLEAISELNQFLLRLVYRQLTRIGGEMVPDEVSIPESTPEPSGEFILWGICGLEDGIGTGGRSVAGKARKSEAFIENGCERPRAVSESALRFLRSIELEPAAHIVPRIRKPRNQEAGGRSNDWPGRHKTTFQSKRSGGEPDELLIRQVLPAQNIALARLAAL
jgi:hypothetical protein